MLSEWNGHGIKEMAGFGAQGSLDNAFEAARERSGTESFARGVTEGSATVRQ